MTEGHGLSTIRIRIADVDDKRPAIFDVREPIEFPNPTAVVEPVFTIRNLKFDQPGDYRFQLFVNEDFIVERKLVVRQLVAIR